MVTVEIVKTFKRNTLIFTKGEQVKEQMKFVSMIDAERWAEQVNRNRKCEYEAEVLRCLY